MVLELINSNYDNSLRKLDLQAMVYRQLRSDMIEVFKIMNNQYYPEVGSRYQLNENTTRNYGKIFKTRCQTNLRQGMFKEIVIDRWNSLPNYVMKATNFRKIRELNLILKRTLFPQTPDHVELLRPI